MIHELPNRHGTGNGAFALCEENRIPILGEMGVRPTGLEESVVEGQRDVIDTRRLRNRSNISHSWIKQQRQWEVCVEDD